MKAFKRGEKVRFAPSETTIVGLEFDDYSHVRETGIIVRIWYLDDANTQPVYVVRFPDGYEINAHPAELAKEE